MPVFVTKMGKVYFRSQILECPSIGEYWNIFWYTSIARKGDINVLYNVLVLFRSSQYWNAEVVQYCPILVPVSGT